MAKVSVLEGELEKAKSTIQKSKKASEVQVHGKTSILKVGVQYTTHALVLTLFPQAVVQEKNILRQKLRSQEEDFRLQNQALLTELSNVIKYFSN